MSSNFFFFSIETAFKRFSCYTSPEQKTCMNQQCLIIISNNQSLASEPTDVIPTKVLPCMDIAHSQMSHFI